MTGLYYIRCDTVAAACEALAANEGGTVLAGGTDLLIELRKPGNRKSRALVDISRTRTLGGISMNGGTVRVGPMTTHAELASSALRETPARLLCDASAQVGSPQIRNRGTIGGNVMNAATCADTIPALYALGARMTLTSASGSREVPIAELFVKPYVTCARADEILTGISFTLPTAKTSGAFIKLGRRNAVSISRLSVAALLTRNAEGTITGATVVPGSAFPVWRDIPEITALLCGRVPSAALFAEAGRLASGAMIAETGRRWSTEYKEPVLAVLVARALAHCCGNSEGGTR